MRTVLIRTSAILLVVMLCATIARAADDSIKIRLNTIGYLPGNEKMASIAAPCTEFTVVRIADGANVFSGNIAGPAFNSDTQEQLYTADFSTLKESGEYRLTIPGVGESAPFRVAADLYNQPFYVVTRGMYLWRCGMAVKGTHNNQTFQHDACHTDDAWLDLITGRHEKKSSTGGWHDAGDYNKYVVNAGITVGCMLRAWEDFPAVRSVRLDIPESGGKLPDLLAEVKWEMDWLFTMQADDGSVYHKVTTKSFGGFILPEREKADRYFVPWSSAATADFVAMMAQASRCFRPYDATYADRCLQAAQKSYEFLKKNPADHRFDPRGTTTGAYGTSDPDDRLWAAAELWETTGDVDALRDLEGRIRNMQARVERGFDWGNVANLGMFTYLNSRRDGRDAALLARVRENVIAAADGIVRTRDSHGYARPFGSVYYWGCNGTVARQVLILQAASRLAAKREYRDASLDALNHLFGRNYDGRSYVTGLGFRPPMNAHDRRSGADAVRDPWPGYLVGGPHPRAVNWKDDQNDYRTNEIAINWNAALIYALAAFVEEAAK